MPVSLRLGTSGPDTDLTLEQDAGTRLRRSVLPGGVRVLTESLAGSRSVTIGAWVAVGSRDEHPDHLGSTHFLEHLLFKGTARRDAMAIAAAFDEVGGEANAVTGKEHTCYYARVLDADLPMATDVLLDMVTSATLDADELELERGVILEELAMNDDDPTDVAHEAFARAVLGSHPLGRPIGGTAESITQVPREAVLAHYTRTYTPAELVITAAGAVDHDALCADVRAGLERGGWSLEPGAVPAQRRLGAARGPGAADPRGAALTIHRSTEQANVLLGGPGLVALDERRYTLSVLNAALGGGMSSRLFQEVREKRGLAYSVYSFGSGYAEAGLFGLYAGCTPTRVADVVRLLEEEWRLVASTGFSDAEITRAVGQLSGSLVLGLEDTGSRMSRLGRAEIVTGELVGVQETLDRLRAVTADEVTRLAAELYESPRSLVVVGPFEDDIAGECLGELVGS